MLRALTRIISTLFIARHVTLESAIVVFIDENGGGAGMRLRKG